MNQNNLFSWGSILFYFSILCFLGINCPHRPGAIISGDPVGSYAPAIVSEYVCDWHSSLYLSECIYLKHILNFIGWNLDGLDVLFVVWYITAFIIFCLLCFFYSVVKKTFRVGVSFDVLCSIFFLANLRGLICFLTIDFVFLAVFLSILALMYAAIKYRNKKYVIWIFLPIFMLLLYQMIEVRKNAIILLPVFLFIGILIIFPRIKKILAFCSSCIFALVFYFSAQVLSEHLFTDQKTYPASVMMMSDMCVAASLRDESEQMRSDIIEKSHYQLYSIDKYKQFQACIPYFPSFPENQYNVENWNQLKRIYVDEWKENFGTMFAARCLQLIQFYLNGYTPSCIIDLYEDKYGLDGKIRLSYNSMNWKTWVTLVAWLVPVVITCVYTIFLTFCHFVGKKDSLHRIGLLVVSWLMLLYLASFIPVTPTADSRYKLVCIVISCFVAAIACSSVCSRFMCKMATK